MAIVLLIGVPSGLGAQERPGSVYVYGGVVFPHQRDLFHYATYPSLLGGTTTRGLIGTGVVVHRHVSVEVDYFETGRLIGDTSHRYGYWIHQERRDEFWSVGVRAYVPLGRRFQLEPVAGVAITEHPEFWEQAYLSGPFPPNIYPSSTSRHDTDLATTVGFTAGADVSFKIKRISILGSARWLKSGPMRRAGDTYTGSFCYPDECPTMTFRPGVLARVNLW